MATIMYEGGLPFVDGWAEGFGVIEDEFLAPEYEPGTMGEVNVIPGQPDRQQPDFDIDELAQQARNLAA